MFDIKLNSYDFQLVKHLAELESPSNESQQINLLQRYRTKVFCKHLCSYFCFQRSFLVCLKNVVFPVLCL